jgi:hypothetical protein
LRTTKQAPERPTLNASLASKFAGLALAGVGREWPHSYQHLVAGPGEIRSPRGLHPAFFGCLDWHSSVHGHWTIARLLRLFPALPEAAQIRAVLDEHLSADKLATELAYFRAPGRGSFERPYGWAWLLALAGELRLACHPSARRWLRAIRPLEDFIAASFPRYLSRLPYPVRSGVHSNTAFALTLALDYARLARRRALAAAIIARSLDFYGADSGAPVEYEPGGEDFLSPALAEADLMSRVLPAAQFQGWLARFIPGLAAGRGCAVLTPPQIRDRRDPKQLHLDGLNLSRAWALQRLASVFLENERIDKAADRHARAGLARVASGNYAGDHWLASFAVYLLTSGGQ